MLNSMKTEDLNDKIQRIRRQNEEIRRRHAEVEADKKNADALSLTATPTTPTPQSSTVTNITRKSDNATSQAPRSQRTRAIPQNNDMTATDGKITKNDETIASNNVLPKPRKIYSNCFAEGDGPPPDPNYRFLADAERDPEPKRQVVKGRNLDKSEHSEPNASSNINKPYSRYQKMSPHGTPPRHVVHENWRRPQSHPPKDDTWRAERAAIDEDRIRRQKTADGNWRREWDNQKLPTEEDDETEESEKFVRRRNPPQSEERPFRNKFDGIEGLEWKREGHTPSQSYRSIKQQTIISKSRKSFPGDKNDLRILVRNLDVEGGDGEFDGTTTRTVIHRRPFNQPPLPQRQSVDSSESQPIPPVSGVRLMEETLGELKTLKITLTPDGSRAATVAGNKGFNIRWEENAKNVPENMQGVHHHTSSSSSGGDNVVRELRKIDNSEQTIGTQEDGNDSWEDCSDEGEDA